MNHSDDILQRDTKSHWSYTRGTLVACVVLVTVSILLVTGHEAHLLGALPYLLLLACPLMHLFMHGGHHRQHNDSRKDTSDAGTPRPEVSEPKEKS